VRRPFVFALTLELFCGIKVHAQGLGVQLGGPLFECRSDWDFAAGGVQVHFSAGQLTGTTSQPPRFEVSNSCGNSSLVITFSSYVKNVQLRVAASTYAARVLGGGSVNPGGNGKIINVAGPTSTVQAFSTGNGSVLVDMISFELADPPALFSFGPTTTGRVLTHKYRNDDAYPAALQTEDGKIRVEGLVHDLTGATPIDGRKVYFRLIDPPDVADYVVKAGDAKIDDNVDGPGKLNGASTATDTSDSSGKVSVTLEITDHAAGDNYQVEASLDKDFKCSPAPCQKSIVYTAWKRVYVEAHKMFKAGSFITIPIHAGDKKIVVERINGFPSVPFKIRLIHASPVLSATADFYSEEVSIVATRSNNATAGVELVLAGENDPAVPGVMNAYAAEEVIAKTVRPYLRDAVGIVTGDRGRDYLLTNGKLVNRLFEDAFVEYVWLSDSAAGVDDDLLPTQSRIPFDGAIPFRATRIGEADEWEREWLTRKWLRNATRTQPGERSAKPNHQAMFVAPRHRLADKQGSVNKGLTSVADDFNDTWLFVHETGMTNTNYRGEATLHELTHQWRVNPVTPSGNNAGGHCDTALPATQHIYNQTHLLCTMTGTVYSSPEASDGIVGFHYLKQNGKPTDSEFLRIRWRLEPVPQNERTGRNPR
jgi:hypothetical protein